MKNDSEWDTFCKAIWPFQYTRNEVHYSPEMRNALYSEALGIPFLAVHIYKLVQEDAILSGLVPEVILIRSGEEAVADKWKTDYP